MKPGTLFLIPSVIAEDTQRAVIPAGVRDVLPEVRYFLVENIRTARRFLSSLKIYESIEPLTFEVLDKDTKITELRRLFEPVIDGANVGIISESGCPGVADPGALAVDYAHRNGIRVVPLVGPSSILLALMGSGLNGQRFAFHGYLPRESPELLRAIKELEKESRQRSQTQIFIETPYRNNSLMNALLKGLSDQTRLTVAVDVTGTGEAIHTFTVAQWRSRLSDIPKIPAIFLFLA